MPHAPKFRPFVPLSILLRSAVTAAILASFTAPVLAQTNPPSAVTPSPRSTPAGPSSLEGLPILRVDVVNNRQTDARLILDQVRAQPGQPYSRAQIDVDTRSVASLDRFVTVRADVEPVGDDAGKIRGVAVHFVVEERSTIAAVEIRGNRQFKTEELRDVLIEHVNGPLDSFSIETDRKSIMDMYHKKGYASVAVNVDEKLLQEGIVRYVITEGPRAKISSIEFSGNQNLKSSYLKFKISTKSYFWIFRKGVLDEEKIQADLVTIRDQYQKRGYLDARVSYFLDYSNDKSKIAVRFAIIEGPRYRIGKINLNFTEDSIFKRFELLGDLSRFGPGSFAEREKIEALQKKIEDRYGHEGYIYREVKVEFAYTDNPGVVDLNFTITPGKPYIVGRIIVRGNPNIQDRVIRRQIRIYPDQTYDAVLVKKSIDRLKGIRIFQDVKITPIGSDPTSRDALVEVAEGQTGRFLVGAGISTNSGIVGQISLEQQNFDITNPPRSMGEFFRGQAFKGAGQYFRILLEPGTEFQQYRVTFEEPYLFDSPYSFSNDIYFFTRSRESWDERRIGDIITLGRRFGDIWGASLSFRVEQVTINNPSDHNNNDITDEKYFLTDPNSGQPVGPFSDTTQEILDEQGSHFLTSIKPGVVRDTTDSRVFPTSGSRFAASLEQYGIFGGDVTFTKLVFRFDKYFTLYEDLFERKTTLALRNEIGFDVAGDSPFYERFYAGGIGSLRGFKFRGVGPRSGPLNDPIGGDFEWISTIEVNYPIWEKILRGVVFVDVGTVERDITIETIRADIGVGARINIPFFGSLPLALDFAVPISQGDKDKTQLISFALGIPL